MKFVTEKKVRIEEEASDSRIEGIRIDGVDEDLVMKVENNSSYFNLLFAVSDDKDGFEYRMMISKQGIRFERIAYRPNHDHNDLESLCIKTSDKIPGPKKGTIQWTSGSPYAGRGWDYFYVDFGSVTKDY